MKQLLSHRPSPAMVVALTALVIAASGTAIAATKLVKGDKLIAKNSISGNRLKNHTITGTQVNLKKLGKVPAAASADLAKSALTATSATSATNATNATNAVNATNLAGQAATAFEPASFFTRTGLIGNSIGQTTALATFGPFTISLLCTDAGGGTPQADLVATSTEPNSFSDSTALSSTPTSVTGGSVSSATYAENPAFPNFLSSTGKVWVTSDTFGVKYLSRDCFASVLVFQS
jgi:hypothetical protein